MSITVECLDTINGIEREDDFQPGFAAAGWQRADSSSSGSSSGTSDSEDELFDGDLHRLHTNFDRNREDTPLNSASLSGGGGGRRRPQAHFGALRATLPNSRARYKAYDRATR